AQREGRDGERARRHAEPTRHHDGLAAGRPGISGRRRQDLRQLDEERPGRRDAGPPRPHGTARRRRVEVLELVASVAGAGWRLQPGGPAQHGGRWADLLLRGELTRKGGGAASAREQPFPLDVSKGNARGDRLLLAVKRRAHREGRQYSPQKGAWPSPNNRAAARSQATTR